MVEAITGELSEKQTKQANKRDLNDVIVRVLIIALSLKNTRKSLLVV